MIKDLVIRHKCRIICSMGYLALEGGVCSGKSTVASIFEGKDVAVLKEYMSLLPEDHACKKTLLGPAERLHLFFGLERDRAANATRLTRHVVADRCVLTILAFELAMVKCGNHSVLVEFAEQNNFIVAVPDLVIFFDLDNVLRKERWMRRGNNPNSIFIEPQFNESIRNTFFKMQAITQVKMCDASWLTIADVESIATKALNTLAEWKCWDRIELKSLVHKITC